MNLTQDNTKELYWKYLFPSLFAAIITSIYLLVDTIAIGKGVGASGTAALSIATPIFGLIALFGLLGGIGGSVFIGKLKGEGKTTEANSYFSMSLAATFALTVLSQILFLIFSKQIYLFFGADENLLPFVKAYADWFIYAMPAFVFSMYLACIVRADGNPNIAMTAVVTGGIFNVFGDFIFVFPLKMGMTGAAIASVLGTAIQTLILASHFFSKRCTLRLAKPRGKIWTIILILKSGFSAGVVEFSFIILTVIMNNQILRYGGENVLAIFGVVITCSNLFQHFFCGLGQAIQPIVSTNFGAQKFDRIKEVKNLAIITSLFLGVLFTSLGLAFPRQITMIFLKADENLLRLSEHVMRIYFLSFLFMGVNFTATYYLQSIMKSRESSVIALLRGIILSGLLVIFLPMIFGVDGVWWGMVATEVVTVIEAWVAMQAHLTNKNTVRRFAK